MADWYCFKDKAKMEETQLLMRYMVVSQHVWGLKCPVCGVEYLTEETVMTSVREAESSIEAK
jgi:hypothetical protein